MSGPYVAAFLIKDSYGELTPHPALRGHLPPRGKALTDQYPLPICRFAAFSALRSGLYSTSIMAKLPTPCRAS